MNEMESYVDVLHASMVLMVFGELDSWLVVREESCQVEGDVKKLRYEGPEPKDFFGSMSYGYVFGFGSG